MSIQNNLYFNCLCAIIPACILVIPASGEIAFALLSIYSLIYCYQQKINPFTDPQTKIIAFIFSTYFCVALFSILASDVSLYAFKRLGTNSHFLIAPWLALLLARELNIAALSTGIKIGAILAGAVAIIQYLYLGQRAHGTVNALPFGDIALLLSFFALLNIHHETPKQKYFSLISFSFGCAAVIFSLSRGAWITAPFLLILLLFIWYKQQTISIKYLISLSLLGLLTLIALGLTPQIQARFDAMQHEINTYERSSLTSIGIRITLWKTAIVAIPTHPILGFGLHNTQQVVIDFVKNQSLQNELKQLGHFHNEYLTALVGKGTIGLLSLLALLTTPIFLFYHYLFPPESRYLSGLVFLLCTGYAFFGLTNLAFGHGIMNTFFVFMLAAATHSLHTNIPTS